MKIVIDIDDEVYNEIKNKGQGKWYCREMDNAIRQGTPLLKGHGRLIDADELIKDYGNPDIEILLENMDTIIEADKE